MIDLIGPNMNLYELGHGQQLAHVGQSILIQIYKLQIVIRLQITQKRQRTQIITWQIKDAKRRWKQWQG